MLEQGLIMPVSLEMDADSDEELETLAEMYDQGAGGNNGDGIGAQQVTPAASQHCGPAAHFVHASSCQTSTQLQRSTCRRRASIIGAVSELVGCT